MMLSLQNVAAGYGQHRVVHDVSFAVGTGEVVCLLGPNGSGKTTLFKAVLGLLPLQAGRIELDGKGIDSWSRRDYARQIAYVPQLHVPPFPYVVLDVVSMGRTPYLCTCASPSPADRRAAEAVLEQLGISHLRDRTYTEISGGERQLVLIARALTQQPRFLIMDEPTSHLDYGNQIRTIARIRELARHDISVILTTHSPDHAFVCATRVVALHHGTLIASGPAATVITPELLNTMYGVDVRVLDLHHQHPGVGRLLAPQFA
jgi:iron complex transport system ATP-binding protein